MTAIAPTPQASRHATDEPATRPSIVQRTGSARAGSASAGSVSAGSVSAGTSLPAGPWTGFVIGDGTAEPAIRLEQIDARTFRLGSRIRYVGRTGLSGLDRAADERIRTVDESTLLSTDLASVPSPCRWWMNTYGLHTPAALIHDRFIGPPGPGDPGRPEQVSEQAIDRYFRFMLRELGVPFLRRWLMWAAVTTRTRLHGGPRRAAAMVAWGVAALGGVLALAVGLASGPSWLIAAATIGPLPASLLWGRQAGAALIIAYVGVPVLLVPSAIALPFLAAYHLVEGVGEHVSGRRATRRGAADRRDPRSRHVR